VVGELIAGRYELEELVGDGGMSSVFRARDRQLDRHVALKVLHAEYCDDAEYVERFRREARAAAQLSHPNIVTVIDRGEDEGRQFIVFEYVDGENLKELVRRSGPLPARRAVELALAVADGLGFAHDQGLVHRDVKPQNVLLNDEGEVKVTDFGIARSLEVERGVTQTGTVVGTSNYISPEQASGKTVTPATDVYSLGVVLYELLTGDVPFSGESFVAVALRHINEPPPDLAASRPDVAPRLAAAVRRALEKDPGHRFPSMGAFAAELRGCLADLEELDPELTVVGLRAAAPPPVRAPGARVPRPGRRRWPWALGLVLLLGAAAVVAAVLGLGGSNTPERAATAGGGGSSPPSSSVTLSGVTAYDPFGGDDWEHNQDAPKATDGNPATFWETSTYRYPNGGLGKDGVGVVVDAGSPVGLGSLTVATNTPGFQATILAGDSESGPFEPDSSSETVAARTTFVLQGHAARYYVVWITNLGPHRQVHVNEVTAG
jgi:eukaryotic-like serine/threonine-protein kinase